MSGWYGADRRGYQLATAAVGLAVVGITAPWATGIFVRWLIWTGSFFAGAFIASVAGVAFLVVSTGLALAARRSPDDLTRQRSRTALLTVAAAMVIGVPIGLVFALFGDPGQRPT